MTGAYSQARRWAVLLVASALLSWLLYLLRLPAAFLIGPMAASIAVSFYGGGLYVSQPLFYFAQGIIGCMIARFATPDIAGPLAADWPIFLAVILAVVAASAALGYLLARMRVLPGTTAVWGTSAGAATVMTLMAEDYGEDIRLVAFMQYLRVVLVAVLSSLVARFFMGSGGAGLNWLASAPVKWGHFAATLGFAGVSVFLARRLRVPGGTILLPLAAGALLQWAGVLSIELPRPFLACAYAVVGFSIGLRFTRDTMALAARALPRVLAAIGALLAACAGLGWVLSRAAGIEPLTAYFATTPGGLDSAAIIGADSNVNMPFVMALQFARFIIVVASGPWIARFVAGRTGLGGKRPPA